MPTARLSSCFLRRFRKFTKPLSSLVNLMVGVAGFALVMVRPHRLLALDEMDDELKALWERESADHDRFNVGLMTEAEVENRISVLRFAPCGSELTERNQIKFSTDFFRRSCCAAFTFCGVHAGAARCACGTLARLCREASRSLAAHAAPAYPPSSTLTPCR